MLKKPVVLAVAGMIAGLGVAAALFTFVFSGGDAHATDEPLQPVVVAGRIGPHIEVGERVFNLVSPVDSARYLKLRALIEFETTDKRWERVLRGCVALQPVAPVAPVTYVAAPALDGALRLAPAAESGGGTSPCAAEEAALLAEFHAQIGTGRALIEDAITTIVTSKTASDIATAEGKQALRDEIRDAVEELIPDARVVRVLFVEFITQ